MGEFAERNNHIPITSPAIARLMRHFKWYVIEQISNSDPIMTLDEFYRMMVRLKEMNKSRIYEKYLVALQLKEVNGSEDKH